MKSNSYPAIFLAFYLHDVDNIQEKLVKKLLNLTFSLQV